MRLFSLLVAAALTLSTPSTTWAQSIDPTPEILDDDGNGLIEVYNIEQLNNVRYSLNGAGYRASNTAALMSNGCPTAGCSGYELVRDLDFAADESYASGAVNLDYRPQKDGTVATTLEGIETATNPGFPPIGDADNAFIGIFEGNGFVIRNLYIYTPDGLDAGLFSFVFCASKRNELCGLIRNLGLIDVYVKGRGNEADVAPIVGRMINGKLRNVYATGQAILLEGINASAGGLIGNSDFARYKELLCRC